jgi:enamine deaminase RidA (YjgF/YER057c/UK114 family)
MERRIVNPWTWQDRFGFVQANDVTGAARTVYCAGQTSVDEDGEPVHAGDMAKQVELALENLETVLQEAGLSLADVVRLTYYTTDVDSFMTQGGPVLGARFSRTGCRPASTLLGVTRRARPELLVEIEATAAA